MKILWKAETCRYIVRCPECGSILEAELSEVEFQTETGEIIDKATMPYSDQATFKCPACDSMQTVTAFKVRKRFYDGRNDLV